VANLGTSDNNELLGPRARAKLAKTLGPEDAGRVGVIRGERSTLADMRETFTKVGLETPKATEMMFSEQYIGFVT